MSGRFQAAVFDLWGTLVPNFCAQPGPCGEASRSAMDRALHAMAGVLGAPEDSFYRHWIDQYEDRATGRHASVAESIAAACRACGVNPEPAAVQRAAAIRLDLTHQTFAPLANTLETLTEIRRRGYRTGLISDCTLEIPQLWPATPFAALIDAPVFSCSEGVKKPDPAIYARACQRLGVPADRCLYVGDGGGRELTGARAAGMTAILLEDPHQVLVDPYRVDALDWTGPRIESIRETLEWLDE